MTDEMRAKWDAIAARMAEDPEAWMEGMSLDWWKETVSGLENAVSRQARVTLELIDRYNELLVHARRLYDQWDRATKGQRARAAERRERQKAEADQRAFEAQGWRMQRKIETGIEPSNRAIAAHFGVVPRTVRNWWLRLGLK